MHRASPPSGSLQAAAAPLLEGPPPPPDPASFLATLIDLRGGVELAAALADLDALPAAPGAPDPAAVQARLADGLADVQRRLDDAFAHALRPRYRLPTPAKLAQLLAADPDPRTDPRARRALQRALFAPYHDLLETQLKRARFALRDLRHALGPELARLSAPAARLEHLDRTLAAATHRASEALYRRITAALEARLEAALPAALAALPQGPPPPEALAPWLAPAGLLGAVLRDGEALCRAAVAHDQAQLVALVTACLG